MRIIKKPKGDKWVRLSGSEEIFIKCDDFNVVVSQVVETSSLMVQILATKDREIETARLTRQLDLERDPKFQILHVRAKQK